MKPLFVSHGAPNLVLHNSEARAFLSQMGEALDAPRAILMVTAHFEADRPTLTTSAKPPMIYDFGGFEPDCARLFMVRRVPLRLRQRRVRF